MGRNDLIELFDGVDQEALGPMNDRLAAQLLVKTIGRTQSAFGDVFAIPAA